MRPHSNQGTYARTHTPTHTYLRPVHLARLVYHLLRAPALGHRGGDLRGGRLGGFEPLDQGDVCCDVLCCVVGLWKGPLEPGVGVDIRTVGIPACIYLMDG